MHFTKKDNDDDEKPEQTLDKVNAFQLMMNGSYQNGKNGLKRRRKHRAVIETETNVKIEQEIEAEKKPKKRGRPRLSRQKSQQNLDNNDELNQNEPQQKAIAAVSSVDTRDEPYMNLRPRKKQLSVICEKDQKENVILLDDSSSSSSSSSSLSSPSPKKQRRPLPAKMPTPVVDKNVLAARQEFLKSSLPESVRKVMEKRKPNNNNGMNEFEDALPFPMISHVQQKTDSIYWSLKEAAVTKFKQRPSSPPQRFKPDWLQDDFRLLPQIQVSPKNDSSEVIKVADSHKYLRKLMEEENGSKNKNKALKIHFEQLFARKQKIEQEQNDDSFSSMWTDKYSPQTADEIVGNESAIDYLKCWLKRFIASNNDKNIESSSDDDEDSDFECFGYDRKKSVTRHSTLIVHGPHGSGKSSSIYAICKEYDVKIIELNASSRRTGKILMQEFQEATRSHQMSQSCLLLIEDVDLVFDHQDEGFLGALQNLTSTTKRPIVLTTNDVKSPLVQQKFANQYKCIQFGRVQRKVLVPWLQALCLVEGYYVQTKSLRQLYRDCNGDIRKCVLQLQYLLDYGDESLTQEKDKFHETLKLDPQETELNCDNNDEGDKMLAFPLHAHDHISTIYHAINQINNLKHSCSSYSNEFALINNNNFLFDLIQRETSAKSNQVHLNSNLARSTWETCFGRLLPDVELHTDYLPAMRQIFEAEEQRDANNPKRGSGRFRHIFQDWGVVCERKDYSKICKSDTFKLN